MATDQSGFCISAKFGDFDEFSDAIREWDLDFRQLDAGESPAELTQLGTADIILTHARLNRVYDQRGGAPAGMRTFALLDHDVSGINWCCQDASINTLCSFDSSGSFEAVTGDDFKVFTFSLPSEKILQIAHQLGMKQSDIIKPHDNIQQLPNDIAQQLRAMAQLLKQSAASNPAYLYNENFLNDLENNLSSLLVEALATSNAPSHRLPLNARKQALKKAVEYIDTSMENAINMNDLCQVANTSKRTLQYAFREHYGVSPKRYILNVRMNKVKNALVKANPEVTTITEIAGKHGFWHMGQFAREYKQLFGKNPSESLRT